MKLEDLLNEMEERMNNRDLSDEYLSNNGNSTREEIGLENMLMVLLWFLVVGYILI